MKRIAIEPRDGWMETVENQGVVYHHTLHPDGVVRPYWNESAYYRFTMDQIDDLERVTNELIEMSLAAAEEIIEHDRFAELAIPAHCVEPIKESWEAEPPSIYGRFDFRYDGVNPPKLLEFNADTPTSLVETGVAQWMWLEDRFPRLDQWNLVHERLVDTWKDVAPYLNTDVVHFAHTWSEDSGEDLMNTAYMLDCATQAGLKTVGLFVEDIGWNSQIKRFVDLDNRPIEAIFKLYPWEWMVHEPFAGHMIETWRETGWIEPMWKMVLSNKGLLPILWELFPDHPNLLPAYFALPNDLEQYARKPLLGREGANVTLVTNEETIDVPGEYGEEGYVFQEFCGLPNFDGNHPVIGSWVIGLEAAGCGIRESDGLVTDNLSRFVPHVIEG